MLTHGNVMADGTTLDSFYPEFNTDGVFMSFFPLAEMFERVVQSVMFTQGGRVGFSRGDIRGLVDDIKTLQPTVLPVVPSVLNEIYDEAMSCFSFKTALSFKWRKFWPSIFRNDSFVDNLVFKKIRDQLGGKVKLMITGSAPLAEKVVLFVYGTFGCFVLNRYGKSECIAATVFFEGVSVPGHVGVPSPCNIIKLVDVPELGYFARDNGGEVCIKGTNVFETYYKNEEQTKEVLDNDGWLHTGDIGRWTEDGTLKIVDCKKHIFKLAKGEYAPERIENIYLSSKFVAQSFVYGESLKTCLIAIIVPDHEVLPVEASKTLGIAKLSMEELCQREDVKKMIMDDLLAVGKTAGLYSFEQVKDIYVSSEMFSVENDLLTPTLKKNDLFTPTLKSKRPKLKEHFKAQITSMYEKLD
uniref:AMP-dependent synthetase/ligase domain-containing protein n=1 Tax=Panagrolaimus sp. ES5 TaxID=591445 RepID=A0AC34F2Q9_9BILA